MGPTPETLAAPTSGMSYPFKKTKADGSLPAPALVHAVEATICIVDSLDSRSHTI